MTSIPKRRLVNLYLDNQPYIVDFSHNIEMATSPKYQFSDRKTKNKIIQKEQDDYAQRNIELINLSWKMRMRQQSFQFEFGDTLKRNTKHLKPDNYVDNSQNQKIKNERRQSLLIPLKMFDFQMLNQKYLNPQQMKQFGDIDTRTPLTLREISQLHFQTLKGKQMNFYMGQQILQLLKPIDTKSIKTETHDDLFYAFQKLLPTIQLEKVRFQNMLFSKKKYLQIDFMRDLSKKKQIHRNKIPRNKDNFQFLQILELSKGGFDHLDLEKKIAQNIKTQNQNKRNNIDSQINFQQQLADILIQIKNLKTKLLDKKVKTHLTKCLQTQQNNKNTEQQYYLNIDVRPIIDKIMTFFQIKQMQLSLNNKKDIFQIFNQKIDSQLFKLLTLLVINDPQFNNMDLVICNTKEQVQNKIVFFLVWKMEHLFNFRFQKQQTKIEIFTFYLEKKIIIQKQNKKQFFTKEFKQKIFNKIHPNQQNIFNKSQKSFSIRTPNTPKSKIGLKIQISPRNTPKGSSKAQTPSTKNNTKQFNFSKHLQVPIFDKMQNNSFNRTNRTDRIQDNAFKKKIDELFKSNNETPRGTPRGTPKGTPRGKTILSPRIWK